jgi:hypothetical protein
MSDDLVFIRYTETPPVSINPDCGIFGGTFEKYRGFGEIPDNIHSLAEIFFIF